jgi:hypothetical protein
VADGGGHDREIGEWMSGLWHEEVQAHLANMAVERPMLKLEAAPQPPRTSGAYGSPMLALVITVIIGVLLFAGAGQGPGARPGDVLLAADQATAYALGELMVKATPLLIIALGLAVCFPLQRLEHRRRRAVHHRCALPAAWRCWRTRTPAGWIVVPVVLAGMLGGMVWAGITRCCVTASMPTRSWSA